jgi:hypothetical protein
MNSEALAIMVTVNVIVTAITIYLFTKVLRTPPRDEPDSFSENDDQPR